ncbi:DUF305 domain-containing protein [Nakamurella antarctica]|uniref:DUF305 domain-containing protein n=1 Tax=Nakamurella antarctica TaxID=1902245 RepID=A0A3G8ZNN8_9ACTN|nr:DUF305 domain-containing protein [Nakamurella antarctica]AZI58863.1 DUF305 domain-containing protein [Nakamurella antarctica]
MRTQNLFTCVAAATTLLLASCGSDMTEMSGMSGTTSTATTASPATAASPAAGSATASVSEVFNDADVAFSTDMIPHHQQAVEMADMVAGRTTTPAVVALAGEIKAAQQPEIDLMTAFLKAWGQQPPMQGMDHDMAPGMEMGMGMMSAADMTTLTGLSGTDFDQKWLTMMIAHHEGAIEMSNLELKQGSNPQAKQLADAIIAGQQVEIATMTALVK